MDQVLEKIEKHEKPLALIISTCGLIVTSLGLAWTVYYQYQSLQQTRFKLEQEYYSKVAQERYFTEKFAAIRENLISQDQARGPDFSKNMSRPLSSNSTGLQGRVKSVHGVHLPASLTTPMSHTSSEMAAVATPLEKSGAPLAASGAASWSASLEKGDGLQFLVSGRAAPLPPGRKWWLGTQSGSLLWPQLEVPELHPPEQEVHFRIIAPQGVRSGQLVLIDAGPEASKLFDRQRDDPLNDFPLVANHLPDTAITAIARY